VEASWVEVAGVTYQLAGEGADWRGEWTVPAGAKGRLRIKAAARLTSGTVVEVERFVLVRER